MIESNAMSRTEELRQKLRNKSFDADFSDFNAKVEGFLEAKRLASAGSTAYMKNLYNRFSEEKPDNIDLWLTEKLKDRFISEKEKPSWPCEPDWCFFDEEPMVFLHQFTDRDGVTIFVFRTYDATDIGARAVYKMIAQDREGKIVLSGDIRG